MIVALAAAVVGCEGAADVDAGAGADGGAQLDASASVDASRADAMTVDAMAGSDAASMDAALDAAPEAGAADAGTVVTADAGTDARVDGGPPDAGERVFGVRVLADSACSELSFDPASIRVAAGTSFTVEWINATGCTDIDIDMGGTVPIVIGLEPGTSHHDTVREWCGSYTGTYFFRAYYSPSFPAYLDVDCSS